MRKTYIIEINPQLRDSFYYPQDLELEEPIKKIAFGSRWETAEAFVHPNSKRKITIGEELAKKLLIPDIPLKLHAFLKDDTLYIGPIVGIFTAGFTPYPQLPLGSRSYSYAKLFTTCEKTGVFPIIFGIQHIHWEQGAITGYYFDKSGWRELETPLPNVIYDRLPNRKVENLKTIQECKAKLEGQYLIPWYNPGFFNKLEVYNQLSENDIARKFLPDFAPLKNLETLENMIKKYEYVFVKPTNGCYGVGIYQLKLGKENEIFCCFRDETNQNRLIKFPSVAKAYNFIQKNNKNGDYCIQQGILLEKTGETNLDFRIHTNKDEQGEWKVTAIGCKRAGFGSPTTHVLSGGTVISVDEVFPDSELRAEKVKALTEAALLLSKELENRMTGFLAEIGFDMGIDREGRVWLFEANSKPGPSIFKHPKLRKYERITQKLVLSYAVHLTEKTIHEPENIFH